MLRKAGWTGRGGCRQMPQFRAWCCSCQHRWCLYCEHFHAARWPTEDSVIPGHGGWMLWGVREGGRPSRRKLQLSTSTRATDCIWNMFPGNARSARQGEGPGRNETCWMRGGTGRKKKNVRCKKRGDSSFGWVETCRKGAPCALGAVMEQKRTDGRRRKFPGSAVPCRWSWVQGLSARGELFKSGAWKREWLHLSHILLKPLQQMCLLTALTS